MAENKPIFVGSKDYKVDLGKQHIPDKIDYPVSLNSDEGITDERYLKELTVLANLIDGFKPELIIYLAGADPYKEDLLGGFRLKRD